MSKCEDKNCSCHLVKSDTDWSCSCCGNYLSEEDTLGELCWACSFNKAQENQANKINDYITSLKEENREFKEILEILVY